MIIKSGKQTAYVERGTQHTQVFVVQHVWILRRYAYKPAIDTLIADEMED
tara:strand:- start:8904 stop:9053 length:150 start_codon:yes stop_codon:yes gene_type:complete